MKMSLQMSTYMVEMIVRGYHIYQVVWEAAVGQVLPCQWECDNVHNPSTVTVIDRGLVTIKCCMPYHQFATYFLG